jgi:hypothetical protein
VLPGLKSGRALVKKKKKKKKKKKNVPLNVIVSNNNALHLQ